MGNSHQQGQHPSSHDERSSYAEQGTFSDNEDGSDHPPYSSSTQFYHGSEFIGFTPPLSSGLKRKKAPVLANSKGSRSLDESTTSPPRTSRQQAVVEISPSKNMNELVRGHPVHRPAEPPHHHHPFDDPKGFNNESSSFTNKQQQQDQRLPRGPILGSSTQPKAHSLDESRLLSSHPRQSEDGSGLDPDIHEDGYFVLPDPSLGRGHGHNPSEFEDPPVLVDAADFDRISAEYKAKKKLEMERLFQTASELAGSPGNSDSWTSVSARDDEESKTSHQSIPQLSSSLPPITMKHPTDLRPIGQRQDSTGTPSSFSSTSPLSPFPPQLSATRSASSLQTPVRTISTPLLPQSSPHGNPSPISSETTWRHATTRAHTTSPTTSEHPPLASGNNTMTPRPPPPTQGGHAGPQGGRRHASLHHGPRLMRTQPVDIPVDSDTAEFNTWDGSPSTPPGEYGQVVPQFVPSKPPQALPPHLLHATLNSEPIANDATQLPRPAATMLNHLYALSIKDGVMVLGASFRYKKKFVTTVLYKPLDF